MNEEKQLKLRKLKITKLQTLINYKKKSEYIMKNILLTVLFLFTACLITICDLQADRLQKLTGQYQIGTKYYYLIDKNRADEYSDDKTGYRWMSLQVWYPAEAKDDDVFAKRGDRKLLGEYIKQDFFRPELLEEFALKDTNSRLNANLATTDKPFPVLIHSSSGVIDASSLLHEQLASHGFIVISVGHPYWCEYYFDANGETTPFNKNNKHYKKLWEEEDSYKVIKIKANITKSVDLKEKAEFYNDLNMAMPTEVEDLKEWAKDISFIIDRLTEDGLKDGFFTGKVDLNSIGVFGYSKGGAAAGQACLIDSRIDAGINMDGFMFGDIVNKGLNTPFMFMEHAESWYANIPLSEPFYQSSNADSYTVRFDGATHATFTDVAFMEPYVKLKELVGTFEGRKFFDIELKYILAFYNKYLRPGYPAEFNFAQECPDVVFRFKKAAK
jgi:predicted dienelactone hydrolase